MDNIQEKAYVGAQSNNTAGIYNSQHALNQALLLASMGIPVFACKRDKKPITTNGFYNATTDEVILKIQFSNSEAVCIGIPTGIISGFTVLDIDFKNGALPWWEQNKHLLYSSYSYQTPSGGYHIYFKSQPDHKCSKSKIAPGIDIKSNGGYVVYHPANGFPVINDTNTPVSDLPHYLINTSNILNTSHSLQPKQVSDAYATAALTNTFEDIKNAPQGERNETLNRVAFGLFVLKNRLIKHAEVKEKLLAAALICGLPESEAKRTIESASKKYKNENNIEQDEHVSSFSFTRADQIKEIKLEYIVDGILSVGSQSCWFGKTGSFKSFGVLSLGLSVSTGTPWYDHAVKQGVVLYICGEGKFGISKRLRSWEAFHKVSLQNAPFYISSSAADFSDPISLQDIEAAITKIGQIPTLIIIDTLNRNTSQDEDKSENMARIIKASDVLKDKYGAAIMWVHHTGHSEQSRPRGSSALTAAMDHEFRFDRDDNKVTVVCTKNKEAEEPAPMRFVLQSVVVNIGGFPELGAVLMADKSIPAITEHLSPQQDHALRILQKCIEEFGVEQFIDNFGITKCVTFDQYKQKMTDARVVSSDEPSSIKRSQKRLISGLKEKSFINCNHQYVWLRNSVGQAQDNDKTGVGQTINNELPLGQTRQPL